MYEFNEVERKALLQIINAASVRGADSRIIVSLLDKLEVVHEQNKTDGAAESGEAT